MYEKVTIKEKVGYYSDNRNIHAKSNNKDYKLISKLIFFRWFFFFSFMGWVWLSFRDGFVLFYGRLAESETLHFLQINQ